MPVYCLVLEDSSTAHAPLSWRHVDITGWGVYLSLAAYFVCDVPKRGKCKLKTKDAETEACKRRRLRATSPREDPGLFLASLVHETTTLSHSLSLFHIRSSYAGHAMCPVEARACSRVCPCMSTYVVRVCTGSRARRTCVGWCLCRGSLVSLSG